MIDLRSDTVTKPTPAMRQAMFDAEVGDDVYGEDPTVNRLETRAAEIAGKEAALFVPTGTMGNVIATKILTVHGQEVICDSRAHILDWELAMVSWFSGCVIRAIETEAGLLSWDKIRPVVKPVGPHWSDTGAICLENTHNMAGGRVYPQAVIDDICDNAHELGVPVHIDGARIFNASAASGEPVSRIVVKADTVMFCLSKGLGAPVGSMLAGPRHLIERGRLMRKRLGGGMRQAGILAAAGLLALDDGPAQLIHDHANAQVLKTRFENLPGLRVNTVETNIVIVDVTETGRAPKELSAALKARGVIMNAVNEKIMRAVTHRDVSTEQCNAAVDAFEEVLKSAAN